MRKRLITKWVSTFTLGGMFALIILFVSLHKYHNTGLTIGIMLLLWLLVLLFTSVDVIYNKIYSRSIDLIKTKRTISYFSVAMDAVLVGGILAIMALIIVSLLTLIVV